MGARAPEGPAGWWNSSHFSQIEVMSPWKTEPCGPAGCCAATLLGGAHELRRDPPGAQVETYSPLHGPESDEGSARFHGTVNLRPWMAQGDFFFRIHVGCAETRPVELRGAACLWPPALNTNTPEGPPAEHQSHGGSPCATAPSFTSALLSNPVLSVWAHVRPSVCISAPVTRRLCFLSQTPGLCASAAFAA